MISHKKCTSLYVTHNKTARNAAEKNYNEFITGTGFFLARINHDQGGKVTNKLFHYLQLLSVGVNSPTTPYHPQENGQDEQMNRSLLSMLRTQPEEKEIKLERTLNKVIHAYVATENADSEEQPENATRPQRDRRTPLTFPYNQLGYLSISPSILL